MLQRNYAMDILVENAVSYSEKQKIYALNEAEQAVVNDRMIGNIYQSALKKRDIDFDTIPNSKGDLKKFSGYGNMVGTLNVVDQLSKKFGIKIPELEIVNTAISNLRTYSNIFEKAFALDIDYLVMFYNTTVYACVEATSLILSSYVEYVKTVNSLEFQLRKGKGVYGNVCINSLDKFNQMVKKGDFTKFANGLINKGKEGFVGLTTASAMTITALALSIVPITRQLIYYIYDSRMRTAVYLDQQKKFLESNETLLKSTNMDLNKKNEVLKKQARIMDELDSLSDKIRVNSQLADKSANKKIKDDNKEWTLGSVSGNDDGFMFI